MNPIFNDTHRMFANSLFIRFSSSSRARAFLRSAINLTSPDLKSIPWSRVLHEVSPLIGAASELLPLPKRDAPVPLDDILTGCTLV